MDWNEIAALCGGFALIGGVFMFATRAIVRDEVRKLNGTYLRRELADVKFQQIEAHFDFIRDQRYEDLKRPHSGVQ